MFVEDFDDTKNLKIFIHFFDCSNQMSITSLRNNIFLFCKMYFEADVV